MISRYKNIYITGHQGLVGSAVLKKLQDRNLFFATRQELDLRDFRKTRAFLKKNSIDTIINCAAKVGGILANYSEPFSFINDNNIIQSNLINAAISEKIENFIFLGSSCIYPKNALQPLKEEYLMTGELEYTNRYYAMAKINGAFTISAVRKKFGYNYFTLIPCSLFGLNDNFNLRTSHVIPAIIKKICHAKKNNHDKVEVWGNGLVYREFLHAEDFANTLHFILSLDKAVLDKALSELGCLNIGSGKEIKIIDLYLVIAEIVGYKGEYYFNESFPSGHFRKVLDSTRLSNLGWIYKKSLKERLEQEVLRFLESEKIVKL